MYSLVQRGKSEEKNMKKDQNEQPDRWPGFKGGVMP